MVFATDLMFFITSSLISMFHCKVHLVIRDYLSAIRATGVGTRPANVDVMFKSDWYSSTMADYPVGLILGRNVSAVRSHVWNLHCGSCRYVSSVPVNLVLPSHAQFSPKYNVKRKLQGPTFSFSSVSLSETLIKVQNGECSLAHYCPVWT